MADNDTPEGGKKRVEIGDLPQEEKELTAEEAKKVKGGVGDASPYNLGDTATHIKAGDGSVNIAGHEISHGINEIKK